MNKFVQLSLVSLSLSSVALAQGTVELASRNSNGVPADGSSYLSAISDDGNVVAFTSSAGNLSSHPGAIGAYSLFLRDRQAGTSELVAVTIDGSPPDQDSRDGSLSADGRYVLFVSLASNLVTVDTNGQAADLFLRDRVAGTTVLAGLNHLGLQSASSIQKGRISANGQWIVFETPAADIVPGDTNGVSDVFVRDLATGVVERVSLRSDGSQASATSIEGCISADGSRVVFTSYDALLPQDTNGLSDVYVLERATGALRIASVGATVANLESHMARLSSDGNTVVFFSWASNLVPNDTNGVADVFWRDLVTNTTGRASVRSDGSQLSGILTAYPAVSGDGRWIGFWSDRALVPGTPPSGHVYVHDRVTGATRLVDAAPDGTYADNYAEQGIELSGDGRWVAFTSSAANLAPCDPTHTNVFVRDARVSAPANYCSGKVNSLGCTPQMTWTGTPSATPSASFALSAVNVPGAVPGVFFYGSTPQNVPFQGGRLCVALPIVRTPVTVTSGAANTCNGVATIDVAARIASHVDPRLVVGAVVHAQFWYRDLNDPAGFGTGLTDAVVFTIQP